MALITGFLPMLFNKRAGFPLNPDTQVDDDKSLGFVLKISFTLGIRSMNLNCFHDLIP